MGDPIILIFAFKRFEFLPEIVAACLRDAPGKHLRLIVDGGESREFRLSQQREISNLLEKFPQLEVVLRPVNLGLRRNILSGISEALHEYESAVILEDDCVPEEEFFYFMLSSLERHHGDKRVRSICGYVPGKVDATSMPTKTVRSSHRFIPWGWGTWSDRWDDYETDSNHLLTECKRGGVRLPEDLRVALLRLAEAKTEQNIWSINWSVAHFLSDSISIYPPEGLIQNRGFDGTGVHTRKSNTFDSIKTLQKIGTLNRESATQEFSVVLEEFMERNWKETLIPIEDRLDL